MTLTNLKKTTLLLLWMGLLEKVSLMLIKNIYLRYLFNEWHEYALTP